MSTTRKTFGAATTEGAEMETWFYRLPQAARIAVTAALAKLGPAKPDFWVKLDVLGRVIR
jgi:hypothetical protein